MKQELRKHRTKCSHRLLLWIHSWLLIGVRATRGSSLARVLISIGFMPENKNK